MWPTGKVSGKGGREEGSERAREKREKRERGRKTAALYATIT